MKILFALIFQVLFLTSVFAWTQEDGIKSVNSMTDNLTAEKVCSSDGAGNPKLFIGRIDDQILKTNQNKQSLDSLYADNQLTKKLYEGSIGSMNASLRYLNTLKKIYIESCMR